MRFADDQTRPRDLERSAARSAWLTFLVMAATWSLHAGAGPLPAAPAAFATLVDQYLDRFGQFHPSIAAGNGLHGHDGELEDFSAGSVATEIRWLRTAADSSRRWIRQHSVLMSAWTGRSSRASSTAGCWTWAPCAAGSATQ